MKSQLQICAISAIFSVSLLGCSSGPLPEPEKKVIQQPISPLVQHLIFFDWDSDKAPDNVMEIIRPHVRTLIVNPTRKILIEGSSDETGDYRYNFELGMKRAKAVEALFIAMGVSSNQLIVRSIGIERKLNLQEKVSSLPRNRRVSLVY